MEECLPFKQKVTGSNPVRPTKLKRDEEKEGSNHIESYNIPKEPSTPVINKTEEKREIKGIEIEPVDLTEVFNFSNR